LHAAAESTLVARDAISVVTVVPAAYVAAGLAIYEACGILYAQQGGTRK